MNRKALEINLWLTHVASRLKVALRPMSLNATIDHKPKLNFKIDVVS